MPDVQDVLQRLFAGREPGSVWLARCPTLKDWRLRVGHARGWRRVIGINGTLSSERFRINGQPQMPAIVLWMDRKLRFVVTKEGLWNLGAREKADD
jgi:hypothetical protein